MTSEGGRRGQLAATGLRAGWTTGACATAGACAAFEALATGAFPDPVTVILPAGHTPAFALTREALGEGWAMAAITKDSGDDPDVTHEAVVEVQVRPGPLGSGISFRAGPGVGTVTLPGLPLAVGEPAINPSPRRMISENLSSTAARLGVAVGDVEIEIGINRGADIARHTLNPRLGIIGGLSVLGTTGVVVPYSCSAWIDSIRSGIDVARAAGQGHVAACTGSTSERVVKELHGLPEVALIDMGDFAGAVLKRLRRHPVARLTLCGGFAKLSKLAAGHLDLHSGRSRVNPEQLAQLAEAAGGPSELGVLIRASGTALGALQAAADVGFPLGDVVAGAARDVALGILQAAPVVVDVVCIDRAGGIVGRT